MYVGPWSGARGTPAVYRGPRPALRLISRICLRFRSAWPSPRLRLPCPAPFRARAAASPALRLHFCPDTAVGEAFRPPQLPLESGDVLLSRAVSSQVPSALRGLTSVFGMGTGGSLSLLSPEIVSPVFAASLTHPGLRTRSRAYPGSCPRSRSRAHSGSRSFARLRPRFSFRGSSARPHNRTDRVDLDTRPFLPLPYAPLPGLSPRPISIIKLHTLPHFHR